jgi:hypothetical protein
MNWRLLAFVVAPLLVQGMAHAQEGAASFHCVVRSSYYMDRGDQPIPNKEMNWEGTKIDVLVHNGKALVTHQLFGITLPVTNEFSILQIGGASNSWILQYHSPPPFGNDPKFQARPTIVINIRTWGLKDGVTPLRFYLDYNPDVMLGTCERTAGEVGYEKK